MEAGTIAEIRAGLRVLESRVDGIHHGLGQVRGQTAKHDVSLGVVSTELANIKEDIHELNGKMTWVVRGLFAAIAVGLMFVVAVATLIIQLSS